MMRLNSQSVASVEQPHDFWIAMLIAVISASWVALTVAEPFFLAASIFIALALAALVRFDYFVYATVFLLPWYPILNLRFQDAFLPLRFVLFFAMWMRLRKRNVSIREWLLGTKRKKGIWLFAGIVVVSVFVSGTPLNLPSFRSLALLAGYFAVFFAIDGWLEHRAQLVRVLQVLLISTVGVALFGICQAIEGSYTEMYFFLYPIQTENIVPWSGRITSFLFQYNSLAGYLNLVIPFAIACAVLGKDRGLKLLGLACAWLGAIAVFLTQSRGGLLALLGVLVLAIWFLVRRLMNRMKILCGGALICILLLPPLLDHFERLQGVDDFTEITRLATWEVAATLFFAHPLLGIGYGNFRFLSSDLVPGAVQGQLEAHNLYLQLLA